MLAAVAIGFVTVLLLLPYGNREDPGLSYDSPYYVWRTRAVTSDGVNVLTTIPTGAVPERPGVPVLGSLLGAVTGTDALTFTVVLRAIAAVAIGLAAGAMAVEALREPRWAFAAFVVGLGASAAVVGTAVGSLDQLLADVLLVAAAAVAPLVAAGRKGTLALGVLFAAAAATHWVFAGLFLLLLAGVALALLPGSLTSHRAGATWTATPSGRLLRAALVAVAAAVVTLAILPALPHRLPPAIGDRGNLLRLDAYELALVLPLAALGFVLTFRRSDGSRRAALTLLGLWAATVPLAMLVSAVLPTPIKLFRVAPFALGIPALVTLFLVTIAKEAGSRWGRAGAVLGAVVLAGGLFWASGSSVSSFDEAAAASITERLTQARTAGRYLDGVSRAGRPVIFVTEGNPRLLDRVVRSAVPPDLIADTWVFVGRPSDLASAGPVDDPSRPRLTEVAQKWWAAAWPDPVPGVRSRPARDPDRPRRPDRRGGRGRRPRARSRGRGPARPSARRVLRTSRPVPCDVDGAARRDRPRAGRADRGRRRMDALVARGVPVRRVRPRPCLRDRGVDPRRHGGEPPRALPRAAGRVADRAGDRGRRMARLRARPHGIRGPDERGSARVACRMNRPQHLRPTSERTFTTCGS